MCSKRIRLLWLLYVLCTIDIYNKIVAVKIIMY